MADETLFTIAGQEFKVTSPNRVLYPETGTTKLEVIRYSVDRTTGQHADPQLDDRLARR